MVLFIFFKRSLKTGRYEEILLFQSQFLSCISGYRSGTGPLRCVLPDSAALPLCDGHHGQMNLTGNLRLVLRPRYEVYLQYDYHIPTIG